MDELIKRINQLAAIAKTRQLSDEEKSEQKKLREQYLKIFRQNFKNQLEQIVIKKDDNS